MGPILAARLGFPFVDLDREIERQSGCRVSELFARDGEAAFRRIEARAFADVLGGQEIVLATGGGTLVDPVSFERAKNAGRIVWLEVAPDVAAGRVVASAEVRPLLTEAPAERLAALLAARAPIYRAAELAVSTSGRTPGEVADEIMRGLAVFRRLPVRLASAAYDVELRSDGLDALGASVASFGARRVVVISDQKVDSLYGAIAVASLEAAGIIAHRVSFRGGEAHKTWRTVERLHVAMKGFGADRHTLVVALGGGIVGDVAGFVAATWMRGVRVFQVPTTLLAQVDSSVGGKTGVNLGGTKNAVGAFHHPIHVFASAAVLETLPAREYRAGLAELVKHGVIARPELLTEVMALAPAIADRDPKALLPLIASSIEVKRDVVQADERETHLRKVLNFGHTIGHAIETVSGFRLRHGEAVGLGMLAAARVSALLGACGAEVEDHLRGLLTAVRLPTDLDRYWSEALIPALASDKKRQEGELDFIVIRRIGEVEIRRVSFDTVAKLLRSSRASRKS